MFVDIAMLVENQVTGSGYLAAGTGSWEGQALGRLRRARDGEVEGGVGWGGVGESLGICLMENRTPGSQGKGALWSADTLANLSLVITAWNCGLADTSI